MATQTVEFRAASGLTLTVRLFAVGSDTIVQTASSCTEATNRKGTYAATFTDPGAAEFELVAFSGATPVCRWFCTLTLTTATFQAYEVRTQAVVASVTVGTNNDKTGYSLTPTTGLGNQTANITGNLSGSVGSVSGSVGSISGVTFPTHFDNLDIAANGHVTATVDAIANNAITASSIQANAITAAKIATDAIGAAQLAADAVTEIQSGLATAANLLICNDRVAYALTALVGACSDAQTAAETYVLSIGGNTYTVDYSGLDASGNRSTTTLTKA